MYYVCVMLYVCNKYFDTTNRRPCSRAVLCEGVRWRESKQKRKRVSDMARLRESKQERERERERANKRERESEVESKQEREV